MFKCFGPRASQSVTSPLGLAVNARFGVGPESKRFLADTIFNQRIIVEYNGTGCSYSGVVIRADGVCVTFDLDVPNVKVGYESDMGVLLQVADIMIEEALVTDTV